MGVLGPKRHNGPCGFVSPLGSLALPAGIVWFLVAYFTIDLAVHVFQHGAVRQQLSRGTQYSLVMKEKYAKEHRLELEQEAPPTKTLAHDQCDSVEGHMPDSDGTRKSSIEHDAWKQMKWALPPAKCRVKGHLIEKLDPENNFRRGVALRFTRDMDDKVMEEQWFLGTRENLNLPRRRVYIDLGGNKFQTSIRWFMERYPCDFTEVHAFEAEPHLLMLPEGFREDTNWLPEGKHGWKKLRSRYGYVPDWMVSRMTTYNKFAGDIDDDKWVNITRFMKEDLKLTPEDTVVVKMDIEGSEWAILYRWLKDPDMPKLVDELFVEVHYYHPDTRWEFVKEWSRDDATRLLAELRFKGFYAHYWQ